MSQAGGGAWTLDLGILSPVKDYPRELIGILGRGRMRLICKFGTTHKCRWGKRPVPWMSLPSALCPSFDRRGAIDVWNDTVWGRIWFGGKSFFQSLLRGKDAADLQVWHDPQMQMGKVTGPVNIPSLLPFALLLTAAAPLMFEMTCLKGESDLVENHVSSPLASLMKETIVDEWRNILLI